MSALLPLNRELPRTSVDSKIVDKEKNSEFLKTVNKIKILAFIGLAFLSIGIIFTTFASLALNQILFHATVATLDIVLGAGAISLISGAIGIFKAKYDSQKVIFNPKRFGLVGLINSDFTCWLNSLMQMLINIPDLKRTLRQYPNFKKFIDDYEKILKDFDRKKNVVDATYLKGFIKTICPTITDENSFNDSHEILNPILDMCRNTNPNLRNVLIEKNHFKHQNGTISVSEKRVENNGAISLPSPSKNTKKDSIKERLNAYCRSVQDSYTNDTVTASKKVKQRFLFNLLERETQVQENIVVGTKQLFLEEKKFAFAPKDLFLNIQRYDVDKRTKSVIYLDKNVDAPLELTLNEQHIEKTRATYSLSSFVRFVGENHYIAYVKKGNHWFVCNDESIKKISNDEVLKASKKAYIVHYKKN